MPRAPIVAMLCGWMTTEIGRQTTLVYGALRTIDSVSPIVLPGIATSLAAFAIVYFIVFSDGVAASHAEPQLSRSDRTSSNCMRGHVANRRRFSASPNRPPPPIKSTRSSPTTEPTSTTRAKVEAIINPLQFGLARQRRQHVVRNAHHNSTRAASFYGTLLAKPFRQVSPIPARTRHPSRTSRTGRVGAVHAYVSSRRETNPLIRSHCSSRSALQSLARENRPDP